MWKRMQWRDPVDGKMSVVMAGDFCPREENSSFVAAHAEEITSGVKSVFAEADLRILQWESVITEADTPILKQGPNLRCGPECLAFSRALGIDVHLLANNHTGDYGPDAILETRRTTENAGIRTVGAGSSIDDARKPLFLDSPAGRIGIVNVAENEFGIATGDQAGAAPYDLCDCAELLKKIRPEVNLLILALHGGHEFYPFPSPRMVKSFRLLADAGADVVFNCHTHCMCGTELHGGTPIIYSPGNFYFPGSAYGHQGAWYFGYLSRFFCDRKGCYAYEIIPYCFTRNGIRLLTSAEETDMRRHYEFLCRTIQDRTLLQRLFEAWCCGSAGQGYLAIINNIHDDPFPPDWNNPECIRRWIHVKNDFCCESHNDLLRQYSWLIANGKTDIAPEYKAMLEQYCHPEWMEKWMKLQAESELY